MAKTENKIQNPSTPSGGNMDFLFKWLRLNGITQREAAKRADITPNALCHWKKVDDARLSSVEKLLGALGFDLIIAFQDKVNTKGKEQVICMNEQDEAQPKVWLRTDNVNTALFSTKKEYKRLFYLMMYMVQNDVTKADLARRLNLSGQTVGSWFSADDIYFSYLYQVADVLGADMYINIQKKKDTESLPE